MRHPRGLVSAAPVAARWTAAVMAGCAMLAGCSVLAGCTVARDAAPTRTASFPVRSGRLAIEVDNPTAAIDSPVHLTVRGAAPGARVRLRADTRDVAGHRWTAQAGFTADATGTVDLDTAAPIDGDYTGAAGMALLWSLHPAPGSSPAPVYYAPPPDGEAVTVTATSGQATATTSVYRRVRAPGVTSTPLTLARDGVIGIYDTPANAGPGPAVLVFGGSGGGYATSDFLALLLAAHGYRALALAYFGLPGLPARLSAIPIEYFQRAVRWLTGRSGVHAVVVAGWSRGSEPAQLLGILDPGTVTAVIALVPSDAAICAYPGCHGPAWTVGGEPVPYTSQFDTPYPTDHPDAVIPAERVKGPMLLACGGADQVWTSCPYQRAIAKRRATSARRYPDVVLEFPRAGHGIAFPEPYLPIVDGDSVQGATPEANEHAREQLWPQILRFLAAAPTGP